MVKEEIYQGCWELVEEGKLAEIHSKEEPYDKISWINADQVYVKCTHCNKIVNQESKK